MRSSNKVAKGTTAGAQTVQRDWWPGSMDTALTSPCEPEPTQHSWHMWWERSPHGCCTVLQRQTYTGSLVWQQPVQLWRLDKADWVLDHLQTGHRAIMLQGSNGCYSPAQMVLCCPGTVPSQQGTVQGSPAAALRLRLVEALLPTTCLLRLVTAFAAGVNSTSLMGSSSESCSTRHSSQMLCNARSQQPSLQYVHVQCGCLCRGQCCCWGLHELKCPPTQWRARHRQATPRHTTAAAQQII